MKSHILEQSVIVVVASVALYQLVGEEFSNMYKTIIATTITLFLFGSLCFIVLFEPFWYRWVAEERNMLEGEFRKCLVPQMITNLLADVAGAAAITSFLCAYFSLESFSYGEAATTAALIHVSTTLPNLNHYLWEDRSMKLIAISETYQIARRVLAACCIGFYSKIFNEAPMNGSDYQLTGSFLPNLEALITVPYVLVGITQVISLVMGALWYGPIFGMKVWLPAMRTFKNDKNFPNEESQAQMPYLILAGMLCELVRTVMLFQLYDHFCPFSSYKSVVQMAASIFGFYMLPVVSKDMWEGKPYALSFVNYSLYLCELCIHFALFYLYETYN